MNHQAKLPTEKEIMKDWVKDEKPKLSIVCIAYNHQNFISSTLNGFLTQKTKYSYEIICYDDNSEDKTREIIDGYKKSYPSIIRTIYPEENQHSKGFSPLVDFILPFCEGAYIARCEGDDFWTDNQKVEKQISFLEKNTDFVLTTHNIHTIDQTGKLINKNHLASFYKRDFSAHELRCGWAGPVTQSMLFRNVIKEFPIEFKKAVLRDVFLASLLGKFGRSKYQDDIKPSMYRIHTGGVFSTLDNPEKFDVQSITFFWMYRYYKRIGKAEEAKVLKMKHIEKTFRELTIVDIAKLLLVKYGGLNLKKLIGYLQKK